MVFLYQNRLLIIRYLVVLVLLCSAVWVIYHQLSPSQLGIDDAFIFFVYARNIANGHGAVYNIGGEYVEGFTSVLWVLIITFLFKVTKAVESGLLVIAILLITTALTALWYFVEPAKRNIPFRGILLLIWVFSSPSFILWMTLPLMDTALWCSLLVIGTIVSVSGKSPTILSLVVALILLARPEGMVWGILFIITGGAMWANRHPTKFLLNPMIRFPLAIYIIILSGLLIFRLFYFGYPLPNTYYAKVSPDPFYNLFVGGLYLFMFVYTNLIVLIGVIPAMIGLFYILPKSLLRLKRQPISQPLAEYIALSLIAIFGLIIPVLAGGDHFQLFRFYQPIWPLLILPLFWLFDISKLNTSERVQYSLIGMVTTILIFILLVSWYDSGSYKKIKHEFAIVHREAVTAKVLNQLFKDDLPEVGVIAAGGIAFFYNGPIFDLLGLNHIAMGHSTGQRYGVKNHAAFNKAVFFEQKPDLLLPKTGISPCSATTYQKTIEWGNVVLQDLLTDNNFKATYQLVVISNNDNCLITYIENNYVTYLKQRGYRFDD